ncbi:hypothetical protein [Selenomonas ruminantium]|uniref:Uncharacterized protein n=1 Tax=Selenomonas ruminantium TaxID=971 RepID=A0A1H4ABB2_SELRU|nr:hypothetical protein [Selenomonas ruminantium]SEA32961.1 hypothetical protein SAMN05660648_02810 [Selenomonas ruminantium]
MEKLMNKMDNMELDKVAGGRCNPGGSKKRPRPSFHDSNANSMAANVDETQMKLPIGGGHKITMAANVFETQNASACVGK